MKEFGGIRDQRLYIYREVSTTGPWPERLLFQEEAPTARPAFKKKKQVITSILEVFSGQDEPQIGLFGFNDVCVRKRVRLLILILSQLLKHGGGSIVLWGSSLETGLEEGGRSRNTDATPQDMTQKVKTSSQLGFLTGQ